MTTDLHAEYLAPSTVGEAVEMLTATGGTLLAGGTDFYPARVGKHLTESVIDISGISELRGISHRDGEYRIGGLTTWTDVVRADLPSCFGGLKLAAREVGGVQIQNAGTIGGNLCNSSPAADGVPPLLTLNSDVELASVRGIRRISLGEFLVDYRKTAIDPDELLTAVLVPDDQAQAATDFIKLGSRKYLVISIVMVAALVAADDAGVIEEARVAVGAASPVAQRLDDLEAELVGKSVGGDLGSLVEPAHLSALSPIDDPRAPADYRLDAARRLVGRALDNCTR